MNKKFKRAVLHVGPDKTGSTAIQFALAQCRELLLDRGIQYSVREAINDKGLYHFFLTNSRLSSIAKKSNKLDRSDKSHAQNYMLKLKSELSNTSATGLILSHEGLCHLNNQEMAGLRDFLLNYTDSVEVVMYVRDSASYATSAMSQRVKTGRRALGEGLPYIKYKTIISTLVDVFGRPNINVRAFSREAFPNGNIVMDFLDLLPLDIKDKKYITQTSLFEANVSLSHRGLLVGDRIVELLGDLVPKAGDFKKLFLSDLMGLQGEAIKLSGKEREKLQAITSKHMDFIRENFNIDVEMKSRDQAVHDGNKPVIHDEIDALARDIIKKSLPGHLLPVRKSSRIGLCAAMNTFMKRITG
ncbi:MAG: hypothetical protein JJU48_10695 [Methylophaga sp.]|nr:hypothetical protein [Methylophaga sp.]